MLELIALLRDHGFRVFVVTGGGVEFVRAIAEEAFGVAPDDVVGSAVRLSLEHRDGRSVLVRHAEFLGSPNEGAPKAVRIQEHIGRRPSVAVGNSAGDREMLEYAQDGDGPSLCLVLDHDDAVREYAYAGASLTDPSAEPILTTAARRGWSVVEHGGRLDAGLLTGAHPLTHMVAVAGGRFVIGSDDHRPEGRPSRPVESRRSGAVRLHRGVRAYDTSWQARQRAS